MANGTLKVSNIETSSGTGTITLGQSGETITVPNGTTVSGLISNTPAFCVYRNSDQSFTDNVAAKVAFDDVLYDTDSAYDNITNYRFTVPTGKAGKYHVAISLHARSTSNDIYMADISFYKNGSDIVSKRTNANSTSGASFRDYIQSTSFDVDASEGDYFEVYAILRGTSPLIYGGGGQFESTWCMHKLIGV